MSTKIVIQNTEIQFPTSGESPNWAPAMVKFAKAVENALNASVGPYDVAPQVQVMDNNGFTDADITNLSFPPVDVNQVVIDYSVQRSITEVVDKIYTEGGVLTCTYRPEDGVDPWSFTQTKTGDAQCEFTVEPSGQIKVSFTALPGSSVTHRGIVSFRARALVSHD